MLRPLVVAGIEETLYYYAFPREHWRSLRTNNPLERLLREVRRRTRAVGAFPDGKSALMLAAARLRRLAGTNWGMRRYLDMNGFRKRAKRHEHPRKNFRLPLGGAEHHQTYASTNVRKTLDTTLAGINPAVIRQQMRHSSHRMTALCNGEIRSNRSVGHSQQVIGKNGK
jgi:hypothetical protein